MAHQHLRTGLATACAFLVACSGILMVLPAAQAAPANPSASESTRPGPSKSASSQPSSSASESVAPQGDSIRAREYWLAQYGITDLWEQATGKGVTVAVIDTGVDGTHQDLVDNVIEGYDASGVSSSSDGWKGLGIEPEHGTLVASMIAGHGHDDDSVSANPNEPGKPAGMMGVAPNATILPISLELGTSTADSRPINDQIPDAVRYAVDHGADIINLSVGSNETSWPESWDSAFAYAEEQGVLIIASAGNRGAGITQVGAPATMPGVLTVGGVDEKRQDSKASSSQGISIAVSAPSESMIGAIPGDKYATWSGTSASAPLVAGLAALIMEKYPDLTDHQVIERIISSADDAGDPGRDVLYGYGIINPAKALAPDTPDDTQTNPLGSMKSWMSVHRKHTESATASPSPTETPLHKEGETISPAATPVPSRPVTDSGILPFIVLAAFAFGIAIITLGSIHRLTSIARRNRQG